MKGRLEILLYYANESPGERSAQENYLAIIALLEKSEDDRHRQIARQLLDDLSAFPEAVSREVRAIGLSISSVSGNSAVLFTNGLARRGGFLAFRGRRKGAWRGRFEVEAANNRIYGAHPLSHPLAFVAALREAAALFPPPAFDFVLVVKSHANPTMAITPRLVINAEDFSERQLLALSVGELPGFTRPLLGISREQWYSLLEASGRELGMRFSAVFLDGCAGSPLEDNLGTRNAPVPQNVERLIVAGRAPMMYQTLDYTALLGPTTQRNGLGRSLGDQLISRGFREIRTKDEVSQPLSRSAPRKSE